MPTIKDSFEKIIARQQAMGYYFPTILQAPASEAQIQQTAQQLGLTFNEELVALYSFANGTLLDEETPCGKTGLIPIHSFLSLEDAMIYYQTGQEPGSITLEPEAYFKNMDTGYMPGNKLFPFLEDGAGNCHWVDLNDGPNYGRLYWTNTFGDQPDYLYNSLTSLFEVIAACYEQDVFFLDEDGFLDCDYKRFSELSGQYNPDIDYWKKQRESGSEREEE